MTNPPTQPDDDDVDHTVVVNRDQVPDDDSEHTVVMDRSPAPADGDEDEHTVVVDRAQAAPDQGDEDEDDEHTVVVERSSTRGGDDDDHTFVVKRASAQADDDDHTVAVDRKKTGQGPLSPAATGKRRRGITQPPIPAGFSQGAVEAVGPGAVQSYQPRAMPDLPPAPPVIESGPDATRAPAPSMPSVRRKARRMARVSVWVFVAACTVSVAGLTIIALVLF